MKIGMIDYYLDEWHANNYPKMIRELSDGKAEIGLAWAKKDSADGLSNAAWSQTYGVSITDSLETLIDQSDCLLLLSPDNPEMHEELAELPLKSGKRTFIDKTFAPSKAAAERIFEMADKGRTPMYSCSALRFSKEFEGLDLSGIDLVAGRGPGAFSNYLIHQVEPIVSLMGADVRRVLYTGTPQTPGLLMDYADGRRASLNLFGWDCPFSFAIGYNQDKTVVVNECTEYFERFLKNMIYFFQTGDGAIPAEETISIMAVLEHAYEAQRSPENWITV